MSPGDLFEAYGRWIVRRRGVALLLIFLMTAVALVGIYKGTRDGLPVDFTPQSLFLDHGPEHTHLERLERTFGRDDNDLVVLLVGRVDTEEGVALLERLHESLAALPQVERVNSLVGATVLQAEGGMLQPVELLAELPAAEAIRQAAADPFLAGLVVGPERNALALRVRIDRDIERVADLAPVVNELTRRARAEVLPAEVELHVTGVPFVRTEVVERMRTEQQRIFPLVGLAFLVAIWALFRRLLVGLGPLSCVLVAITWVMGVLLTSGVVFNILSILVPTLVLVIGVADGIHLVDRFREELHRHGDRELAMGLTMRHLTLATFLTTFTTGAGFASLMVANTKVMRDFGVQAAVAMAICWVAIMLTLPTWLAFIPVSRVGVPALPSTHLGRLLEGIDGLVRRRPGRVLFVCALLVALAGFMGSGVRTNSALLEMYQPNHPTTKAVHAAETHLSGVIPMFAHFQGEPEALKEPDALRRVDAVERLLAAEPAVRWTGSPASYIGRLHHLLTDEDGLPDSREAIAQELLVAEIGGAELPTGLITEDWSEGRILALVNDAGGRNIVALKARVEAEADTILQGSGLTMTLSGDAIMASTGVQRLIGDLLKSIGLVFLIIIVVLRLLLGDMRLALVSAVPNLVPLVFTLATLGIMGADLQTSNIVSFTVAVGLAVDDTIHFIVRFRQERLAGDSMAEAMTRTYRGAGHAIVLTSMLLVLGFALLTTSELTSTRHFGILSCVTMTAALLGDLFVLPALLWITERSRGRA